MMLHKKLIFVLGFYALGTVLTQNTTLPPLDNTTQLSTDTAPYYLLPIYSLHYNISQKNISPLIFELLIEDPHNSVVSTEDLLNLLDSRELIIPPKLIDFDIENLIKIANIDITNILHDLTLYVPLKKIPNLRKILTGFNIDFDEYQEYFIGVDDTSMFNLIKSGNYTEESIQNALRIMQKTEKEMIEVFKTIFFKDLMTVPVWIILSQYDEQLEALFCKKGVSSDEIAKYGTLVNMLEIFINVLEDEVYWATAVSGNNLITVLNASLNVQQYSSYIDTYLKNIENQTIYAVASLDLNHTFSIITVEEKVESFITIKYNPMESTECYYLIDDGQMNVYKPENITFKKNVIFTENNEHVHKLGSPLICENQLYGILVKQDENRLAFLTFSRIETESALDIPNWDEDENIGGSGVRVLCVDIILIFVMIMSSINLM